MRLRRANILRGSVPKKIYVNRECGTGTASTGVADRAYRPTPNAPHDRKSIRMQVKPGIVAPAYVPRSFGRPSKLAPFRNSLWEKMTAIPELPAVCLTLKIRAAHYGEECAPLMRRHISSLHSSSDRSCSNASDRHAGNDSA